METLKNFKEFKDYWSYMYGDVLTDVHDEVFKLFLLKYNDNIEKAAEELNEFCKLDEEDERYEEDGDENWINNWEDVHGWIK